MESRSLDPSSHQLSNFRLGKYGLAFCLSFLIRFPPQKITWPKHDVQ